MAKAKTAAPKTPAPKKKAVSKAKDTAPTMAHVAGIETKLLDYIISGCDKADVTIQQALKEILDPNKTAAQLAHTFVAVRSAFERWEATYKILEDAVNKLKLELVPKGFENEGLTSFTLEIGYRVTVSQKFAASIRKGMKDEAYDWLRKNKLGDIIVDYIHPSTMAATGKTLLEDQGMELPEELFNAAYILTTSMTKTK